MITILAKRQSKTSLFFRFSNSLFEPVWNRNYIDHVEITAAETVGVENRAAFYEETGALRDMVANHLLQLLALTAMEPPLAFDADSVREQKVQVLRSIRPMSVEHVARYTVRGQYGPARLAEGRYRGIGQEPDVNRQLHNRDLRSSEVSDRELALGRGSFLHPHRASALHEI